MTTPRVSVVVPFFERLPWLESAVASVLSQSFGDLELVLVDDGSKTAPDRALLDSDPRIRYLRQPNRGPAAARNLGLASARGRFVAFLDSDDLFLPGKLQAQVEAMEEHPSACLSHTSYWRLDESGERTEPVRSGAFTGRVHPLIALECPIATPTVMLRRELLGEARFDESLRIAEDVLLWTRLARGAPILGVPELLTGVRIHGRSAAFDPVAQRIGMENKLSYARTFDPELLQVLGARTRSGGYVRAALCYLRRRDAEMARRCVKGAAAALPGDLRGLIGRNLPAPVLRAIRAVRDRAR